MRARSPRRPRPPLDQAGLKALALTYVARFATSRVRLGQYLGRKLAERGWAGPGEPPVGEIVERAAEAGYVDDPAFALSRARSLGARGYGERRVAQDLRAAGIEEDDKAAALDHARDTATDAALRFARRRRLGPFADSPPDRRDSDKALAAMIRAGHDFALAKRILDLPPNFDAEP